MRTLTTFLWVDMFEDGGIAGDGGVSWVGKWFINICFGILLAFLTVAIIFLMPLLLVIFTYDEDMM